MSSIHFLSSSSCHMCGGYSVHESKYRIIFSWSQSFIFSSRSIPSADCTAMLILLTAYSFASFLFLTRNTMPNPPLPRKSITLKFLWKSDVKSVFASFSPAVFASHRLNDIFVLYLTRNLDRWSECVKRRRKKQQNKTKQNQHNMTIQLLSSEWVSVWFVNMLNIYRTAFMNVGLNGIGCTFNNFNSYFSRIVNIVILCLLYGKYH